MGFKDLPGRHTHLVDPARWRCCSNGKTRWARSEREAQLIIGASFQQRVVG